METAKGANRKIKNQAEYSGPSWNLARNTSEIVWGKSYCFVIFVKKIIKKNFQNNFQKGILLFHLKDLLQELQLGSLKVLDVLHAYQWKALESNEKLNNIVWVRNIINFISQLAHFIATYFYRFSHKYYYKVLLYTAGLNSLARYIPIYF